MELNKVIANGVWICATVRVCCEKDGTFACLVYQSSAVNRRLCVYEADVTAAAEELDMDRNTRSSKSGRNYTTNRSSYRSVLPRRIAPYAAAQKLVMEQREVDKEWKVIFGVRNLQDDFEAWNKMRACTGCTLLSGENAIRNQT